MKNLFLTLALMCSVSFAFANDGDKKESPKMKETVEQNVVSKAAASFGVECFGLSCTTWCTEIASPTTHSLITIWEMMEAKLCAQR